MKKSETLQRRYIVLVIGVLLVGGAALWGLRSMRDDAPSADNQGTANGPMNRPTSVPRAGTDPSKSVQAREDVKRAMDTDPRRLASIARLPPFDKDAFARDPEAYLKRVEPARCFQTAKPGPGVPRLTAEGTTRVEVTRGEPVALWVKTVPNAPVTFTSFTGGNFSENSLASVSLQADARGLAAAHFVAGPGVDGDISIMVGSPLASGTERFVVRVAR